MIRDDVLLFREAVNLFNTGNVSYSFTVKMVGKVEEGEAKRLPPSSHIFPLGQDWQGRAL